MDVLMFLLGVGVGGLITYTLVFLQAARGNLIVDFSDPNKDIFRFELDNFDDLYDKDLVMCRIVRYMDDEE